MMARAHERYNRLFRQTHKTFEIHHLALLMFKDYITILVGTLQMLYINEFLVCWFVLGCIYCLCKSSLIPGILYSWAWS